MKILGLKPTLDTNAYGAGDAVGGLLTFDFGRTGLHTIVLKKAEILDDLASPDSADLVLHLFTDPAMAKTDNAAFTVSNADVLAGKYIGSVTFAAADYAATALGDQANAVLAVKDSLNMLIPLTNGGKIYGQLQAVGTPTFAATQLVVRGHFAEYA